MRPESLPTTKKSFCIPISLNGTIFRMTPNVSYLNMTYILPVCSSSLSISRILAPLETTSSCLLGPEKDP